MSTQDNTLDLILKKLNDLKSLVQKLTYEVQQVTKDDFFHNTPYQYVNGMLQMYDHDVDRFMEVPLSTQIEHERWQIRTFGRIDAMNTQQTRYNENTTSEG